MSNYKIRLAEEGPFPVNHELAGVVPMALEAEQVVLVCDIKEVGQKEPITLWRGEVVDGRCRQRALTMLSRDIIYKELDDELEEEEVRVWVKSVNTRRNLTNPQKIAVACKQYLNTKNTKTILEVAKAWGIGVVTLNNALWIFKQNPAVIETIFNGGTVTINDRDNRPIQSNKITSIYAYMKKESEVVIEVDKGWTTDSVIRTQAGKNWYYEQLRIIGDTTPIVRLLISELANFKFATPADI